MEQFIGCDAHKHYSVFVAMNERGEYSPAWRASHDGNEVGRVLDALPAGSRIAVEATGYCYWLIDEMRSHGHKPVMTHPVEAKRRMNRTLKWAFVEAAQKAASQEQKHPESHATRLYRRIREKKNHQKAAVAVARHLAEAAFGVLNKKQVYREPMKRGSATGSKQTASLTHE